MRTVLPSDVVNVIEGQFPWTRGNWRAQAAKKNEMRWYAVNTVPGILKMIEGVPEDLLTFGSVEYGLFTMAIAALEVAVARGKDHEDRFNWPMIVIPKQSEQEDCLVFVKNALSTCPDQAPSKSTKGLTFISDAASRETLLIDLASAESALNAGDWKACTVLSGSIVEALLLWTLQQHSVPEISAALATVDQSKNVRHNAPPGDLTASAWRFHDYVHVAAELKEIGDPLYGRCLDAKDYRNLIHPAVSERRKAACDRGTSHVTIGAVYGLIETLQQKHGPTAP